MPPMRRRAKAAATVLAALAVAAAIPLLAGCRFTLVAPATAAVNPFVGSWTAAGSAQRITYRFDAYYRYERENTSSSGATSISVSVLGAYSYEPRTRILSLTPADASIDPEQFTYQFPKRDTLVLTTYPRGVVNVTLTLRRNR